MKLKQLTIQLQQDWQANRGKYIATVEYEQNNNEVKLVLDAELSGKLLVYCGTAIHSAARIAAQQLEDNIKLSISESKMLPEIAV